MLSEKKCLGFLAVLVLTLGGTLTALAGGLPDDSGFLPTEVAVTGQSPSLLWNAGGGGAGLAWDQIGDQGNDRPDEFFTGKPDQSRDEQQQGPSNLGEKVKAGFFSALLPGAGQYYNGNKSRAYVMAGAETAIWVAYFVFDKQGNNRMDSAEEFAGIYAGTQGYHPNPYWQSVGRYMDGEAYNDSRRREARALQEPVSGLVTGSDSWQWVNDGRRTQFLKLRVDGNNAYDRRDFMILFSVVNRAVSVIDAVIGAGKESGPLQTQVLGLNLEVQMLPSWQDPGAQCLVSRSF